MPEPRIIDTNVPLTAAGVNDTAPESCRENCELFIVQVLKGYFCIVIDEDNAAYDEYRNNMYPDPNPSSGMASNFLMYIIQNFGRPERVNRIPLSKDEDGEYISWPRDPDLADFDPADRKWVALALAFKKETSQTVPVTYAIERDWDDHRVALTRHGVVLDHLCAES